MIQRVLEAVQKICKLLMNLREHIIVSRVAQNTDNYSLSVVELKKILIFNSALRRKEFDIEIYESRKRSLASQELMQVTRSAKTAS